MPIRVDYTPRPFVRESFQPTLRMGDLLRQQGAQAAEAEARRGDRSAQLWAGLGQTVANTVGNYAKAKADEPRQQAEALAVQDAADQRRGNKQEQAISKFALTTNENGVQTFDRNLLTKEYTAAGIADRLPHLFQALDAADASSFTLKQAKQEALSGLAYGIIRSDNSPVAFNHAMEYAVANGLMSQTEAKSWILRVGDDPSRIGQVATSVASQSPKFAELLKPKPLVELNKDTTLFDPNTNEVVARGPAGTPTRPDVGSFEDYVLRTYGQNPTPQQIIAARKLYNQADDKSALDTTSELSSGGLDAAAAMFAKTGQLPALGMGAANLRARIINRAAEMIPDLDLASNKADYAANASTLTALQRQRSAIGAFEQTAIKNIDLFLDAAGRVVDTGSPLANSLARTISGQALGSPDQAKFDAARQVAINEIAKITTNPNLTGQLSDTARKEVDAFNPSRATLKQAVAVMRLLKQDMANRTNSLDEQISAIQGRLKGRQAPTVVGPPADAPAVKPPAALPPGARVRR